MYKKKQFSALHLTEFLLNVISRSKPKPKKKYQKEIFFLLNKFQLHACHRKIHNT